MCGRDSCRASRSAKGKLRLAKDARCGPRRIDAVECSISAEVRTVSGLASRCAQHERVQRNAINKSLNTASPGVPRTSTRAPRI